jgi:hypothetical protein
LLEGTGLTLQHLEVDGEVIDARSDKITTGGALMHAWCYLAQLVAE